MKDKLSSAYNVQKIRDDYITSLEAKLSSYLTALRDLEAANEARDRNGMYQN